MINKNLTVKLTKKRKHKVYKEFGLINFETSALLGVQNLCSLTFSA